MKNPPWCWIWLIEAVSWQPAGSFQRGLQDRAAHRAISLEFGLSVPSARNRGITSTSTAPERNSACSQDLQRMINSVGLRDQQGSVDVDAKFSGHKDRIERSLGSGVDG